MAAIDHLRVLADWGRTGAFDHALSDITGRVLSAEWGWGFPDEFQLVAPPAAGTLVLDNADGAFSLGKTGAAYASLLTMDVLIRFQHDSGAVLLTLRVRGIDIAPGTFGPRVVTLTLEDWHAELMQSNYDPPITTNTTTGEAIEAAWDTGLIAMPYASSWWVLGASLLGVDTVLYDPAESYAGDTGQTTLPYVGDNADNGEGLNLLAFINEMCTAEMDGRFLYTPSGKYKFRDRHAIATAVGAGNIETVQAEWLRSESTYRSGTTLLNTLEVTQYPRTVGSAGTELVRTTSPMAIAGTASGGNKSSIAIGQSSREITLRYRDPDDPQGTCAATTIIQPVASTDYTGNLAADGSGEDYTNNLVVTVENLTNSAKVTINNTALGQVYLTMLKIRGTPLTARQPVKVRAVHAGSVHTYGRRVEQRTIAGVHDTELVQAYADSTVNRRADQITTYRAISFEFPETTHDPLWPVAFPNDLLLLRVVDPAIEDAANARVQSVAGVQHQAARGTGWQATYMLEDAVQHSGWVLGNSELSVLGETTRPIF